MPVHVCKEVLPSPGMLEGGGQQPMKFLIIGLEGINLIVKVILQPHEFILLRIEVVVPHFDLLKLSNMLLRYHNNLYPPSITLQYNPNPSNDYLYYNPARRISPRIKICQIPLNLT